MVELLAVAGKPVIRSRSPHMHNAALSALGLDAIYIRLAALDGKDALESARDMGISGLNITSPFKEECACLCDSLDGNAETVGAVNTVLLRKGKAAGWNTDVEGVEKALLENGVALAGSNAIVLGAGGAAKAAALALLRNGTSVTITNRTAEKARKTARMLGCGWSSLERAELQRVMPNCSIIVSCISSTERIIPPGLLVHGMSVLDANYSMETRLAKDAKRRGCRVISGEEWLLFQGAKSFGIFTGLDAPVQVMRKALSVRKMARKSNVSLVGLTGSGKSTTAKLLGTELGAGSIDLDREIERRAGMPVSEIFGRRGERAFRAMEREQVRRISRMRRTAVACGGGAVLSAQNVRELKRSSNVVWLWASPKAASLRVDDGRKRPLLAGKEKERALELMLEERLRLYAKAADIAISTERKKPGEIARLIADEINNAV